MLMLSPWTGGSRRHMRGLTLVELMVSIVVGLVVIGSTLTFTIATLRAYTENVTSTRLTQDLRTAMTLAVREIRRSGYDPTAVARVLSGKPTEGDVPTISSNCVLYGYEAGVNTSKRGLRLNATSGALQAKHGASVKCDDASGWHDVTDPSILEINQFIVREHVTPFCGSSYLVADTASPPNQILERGTGSVRNFSICIRGRLRIGDVQRTIIDTVRVRAEELKFSQSPLGTPFAACPTTASAPLPPASIVSLTGECTNGT